jgi:hypothetical protein
MQGLRKHVEYFARPESTSLLQDDEPTRTDRVDRDDSTTGKVRYGTVTVNDTV